jgi:hypothetical protein
MKQQEIAIAKAYERVITMAATPRQRRAMQKELADEYWQLEDDRIWAARERGIAVRNLLVTVVICVMTAVIILN